MQAVQAELKSPLLCREPRTMSSQGSKRTTKEVSSDLKFQNSTLPKLRSWPHPHSTTAQDQSIHEPPPRWERSFTAAPEVTGYHSEDEYEDPELQMVDAWPSMKILPARPIKESEYADTRCFKRVTDTPTLLHAKTSLPPQGQSWNVWTRLEEVDKAVSKDMRSHHAKENKSIRGNKAPVPPPRPPTTLPKQHQPLPPAPAPESCTPVPQRHTSPEAQGRPREGKRRKPKPEKSAEGAAPEERWWGAGQTVAADRQEGGSSPPAGEAGQASNANHSRVTSLFPDGEGSMRASPAQRGQCPGNTPPHEDSRWRKPFPARPDEKDVRHNQWYVGQYGRQEVEEALTKENKDGTFLVRDCSTKSKAEPYVLVVFYGNKVYNVKIRFLERSQQFALGTGLRGDEKFDSVEDIIAYYKCFPITLIDGKDKTGVHREQCYLTQPLPLPGHFPPG
ncbi:cytokine-dependent hematopoietic cell linker [Sciurus carolinensis]|uniref:cytokine-dependent hematopoietic cell linker n=1 Tax=Sciurus carolinensis TaxID=30640 RepID=UPI001FB3B6C3|nr:cytokine-dependent hematopoietic cell linker [Sciurus carolinensis]